MAFDRSHCAESNRSRAKPATAISENPLASFRWIGCPAMRLPSVAAFLPYHARGRQQGCVGKRGRDNLDWSRGPRTHESSRVLVQNLEGASVCFWSMMCALISENLRQSAIERSH